MKSQIPSQTLVLPRCYDSHLHLIPTGEMEDTLQLKLINSAVELSALKIDEKHRRGNWIIGFGWDQHSWDGDMNRTVLDKLYPANLVSFSRQDYHATWVNTEVLKKIGYWKPKKEFSQEESVFVEFGNDDFPSGILRERAADRVWNSIDQDSAHTKIQRVKSAVRLFNKNGLTHIREMMGTEELWNILVGLDQAKDLSIYAEVNFHCPSFKDIDSTLALVERARVSETRHLKVGCVKIFVDGALGSEGALLDSPYLGSDDFGLSLWSQNEVLLGMKKCFEAGVGVCAHALGDAAVHRCLTVFDQLKRSGVTGPLHIEHCEVLDQKSEPLCVDPNLVFHLQPSHLLTDERWLKQKLGSRMNLTFPWCRLEKLGAQFCFGSDSPIEPPELALTQRALLRSEELGWPKLEMDWTFPHIHPDSSWGPKCRTEFNSEIQVSKVYFDNELLISEA